MGYLPVINISFEFFLFVSILLFVAGYMTGKVGPKGIIRAVSEGFRMKMILCVRKDLEMSKGKIAAQCAHAAVGAYRQAEAKNASVLSAWLGCGQPKIAVQIKDEAEMDELEKQAKMKGLLTFIVHDAGHTQVAAGSKTVIAIGPGGRDAIESVTGHLKLL